MSRHAALQDHFSRNRVSYATLSALMVASLFLLRATQSIETSVLGDSGVYLFTAQSLLNGNGLLAPDGEVLTIFPPGYPILLAAIATLGISVTTAASIINLISMAALIPLSFILARITLGGKYWPLITATIVATSASVYRVFSNAWTEPPFIVLMLITLILLTHIIRKQHLSWILVLWIGGLISLATTLRYVGVFMIPVAITVIGIVALPKREYFKTAVVLGVSLLGLIGLGTRNLSLGVDPLGERIDGALTLQGSLEQFVRQLGVYVAPPESTSLTSVAGAVLLLALIGGIWLIFVYRVSDYYPAALFFIIFWGGLMWSQTSTRIDVNPERLGSPAFVSVVILGLFALRELSAKVNEQMSYRLGKQSMTIGISLTTIVLAFVISTNLLNVFRIATA